MAIEPRSIKKHDRSRFVEMKSTEYEFWDPAKEDTAYIGGKFNKIVPREAAADKEELC